MRAPIRVFALGSLAACAVVANTAHAGRTEIVASFGVVSPSGSAYRRTAEALGYDRRSLRHVYEGELGALHAFNSWLSVGPIARLYAGRMGAPYDGVEPIATYGGSLAARVEVDLFRWPRLFAWLDPEIGVGSIGNPDGRATVGFWGFRAGVGLGTLRDAASMRLRIGYAYAPTFQPVNYAGVFNYGGFLFQIDGVLRVAE